MIRSGLAPALVGIRADLELSHGEGELLATVFLLGYLAALLPGGAAGDRFGRRRLVLTSAIGWCLVGLLIAAAPSFLALLSLMAVLGGLIGVFNSNDRPTAAAVIPAEHMMLAQSISFSGLGVGSGVGMLLAGYLVEQFGWRGSYAVLALLAIGAVATFWRLLPEPVREAPGPLGARAQAVLTNRNVWLIGVGGFPTVAGIWTLMTWAPTILLEQDGPGVFAVSLLASLVGFVALPALAGTGLMANRVGDGWVGPRSVVVLLHLVLVPVMLLLAWAIQSGQGLGTIAGLMVLSSFLQWGPWGVMWAMVAASVPRDALGLAVGFTSTLITAGTLVFPWLAGSLRDSSGSFAAPLFLLAALTAGATVLLTMVSTSDILRGGVVPGRGR